MGTRHRKCKDCNLQYSLKEIMSRFREKDRRLQITGERHVIIPLQIINTKIGKVKPF